MRPRLPIAVALAVVLAGCASALPATPNDATTTTAEPPELTPKPLPDRPGDLTEHRARSFVQSYERAYKWNRERTDDTVDLTINPVRTRVTREADGFVVHLEVGVTRTVRRDGAETVGDGFYTVNYFINETALMRAQTGGQTRPGPDPRNGTVVE